MRAAGEARIDVFFCNCNRLVFKVALTLCRKILNDLSSDAPAVPRIEEEKSEDDSAPAITTVTMPTPIYQTSSGQYSKYYYNYCNYRCIINMEVNCDFSL